MPVKLNGSTSGYVQLQAAAVAANNTLTLPNSGTTLISDATLPATAPTNGQIPIGNGTTYVPATITAGSGISVTNGAGSISIAATSTGPNPTVLTYNSSSTWTKATDVPAGCTMAMIEVWGGGGGGARSTAAGQCSGGGGGGYDRIIVPISSLGATETVTVGAAGLGATTATSGGTGGTSSFGTTPIITVYGGLGGDFNGGAPCGVGLFSTGKNGGGTTFSGKYNGVVCAFDGTGNTVFPNATLTYGGNGGGFAGPTVLACIAGSSTYGGGGGGGGINAAVQVAGTSTFGGNGGAGAATPSAGTQPGGGGGASTAANVNGANGGAGRVKITMW